MKTKSLDTGINYPCAWISVDGGRKKIYDDKFVYLKDGQTFEIELKNPTTSTYLAKIKLNGNYISETGLVLRPGEKVLLKRYLDSNNAFVFRTYQVEANDAQVEAAIANNGLLEVEFYAEQVILNNYINTVYYPVYKPYNPWPYDNVFYYSNTGGGASFTTTNTATYSANLSNNASFTSSNACSDSINCSYSADANLNDFQNSLQPEMKETGTVEKGGTTDQNFRTVDKMFYSYASYSTKYQILPESLKPIEAKEVKLYCSHCGKKCKQKDNFCSKCGKELLRD